MSNKTDSKPRTARKPDHDAIAEQAMRDLKRLEGQSEVVGTSAFSRAARMLDGEQAADDPIELWGRRIGRSMGILAIILLAVFVLVPYVMDRLG